MKVNHSLKLSFSTSQISWTFLIEVKDQLHSRMEMNRELQEEISKLREMCDKSSRQHAEEMTEMKKASENEIISIKDAYNKDISELKCQVDLNETEKNKMRESFAKEKKELESRVAELQLTEIESIKPELAKMNKQNEYLKTELKNVKS